MKEANEKLQQQQTKAEDSDDNQQLLAELESARKQADQYKQVCDVLCGRFITCLQMYDNLLVTSSPKQVSTIIKQSANKRDAITVVVNALA